MLRMFAAVQKLAVKNIDKLNQYSTISYVEEVIVWRFQYG